jgi:hypothetical protein
VWLNHTVRYANGTRRSIRTIAVVSSNRSRYEVDRRVTGVDGGTSWVQVRSTGYSVYLKVIGDGPGRVRYEDPSADRVARSRTCTPVGLPNPTFNGTVERAFDAVGDASIAVQRGRPDRYRIAAEGRDSARFDPEASNVTNLTVGAVVEERGVVRYLRIAYAAQIDGTPARVTTTIRTYDVGTARFAPRPLSGSGVVVVSTGGPGQCE